jgi:predicted RNA-binding Zn-ribbon protein involved in translation (DUF1610 family)
MKKETSPKICPRCKKNELHQILAMNALSRLDNETYICSNCGTEEAFDAYLASFGPGHSER